jgi:hypothetical protein
MPKWQQWETSSEADWTLALERECVVRPLAESGMPTKEGLRLAERPSVAALAQEVKRRFSEQGFPSPRTAPDDHGENLIQEGLSRLIK